MGGSRVAGADVAEVERRLLAIRAPRPHVDPYRKKAAEVYGVPYDKVTQQQRRAVRRCDFASLYGVPYYEDD